MKKLGDLYREQGKYAQAEALYVSVADGRRKALGPDHPDTLDARTLVGRTALLQHQHAAAEATLREALTDYEKAASDTWARYNCQSLLGASLVAQKRFAEAESMLLSGYEGMVQRKPSISAPDRGDLTEAGNRIVAFYKDWGKSDTAAEWQNKLGETTR